MLAVLPRLPQLKQRRVAHDDRGIDAHPVRPQRDELFRRAQALLVPVPGKPRHHLQDQPKARLFDKPCGALHILRRVPAPGKAQHLVVHRLCAELDGLHAVSAKPRQHLLVDRVRACGEPDAVDPPGSDLLLGGGQQRLLLRCGDGREAAPIKGQLPLCPVGGQGGCLRDRCMNGVGRGRLLPPGDTPLIAEDAVMRTTEMRHKYGDDSLPCAHFFSASSAMRAAICSASFLVRPVPSPAFAPLTETRKVKRLS